MRQKKHFLEFAHGSLAPRSEKPRKIGITDVFDPIPPEVLERYGEYIDSVKLLDPTLWAPSETIERAIALYKQHNIEVHVGGIPEEICSLSGKMDEFLAEAKRLGVDIIEYETHVIKPEIDQIKREVQKLKKMGFKVYSEVGAKWWWKDKTRISRDVIKIDKTIEDFELYLKSGCDKVIWEGLIVQNLIGKRLDNKEGQKALLEVAEAVGPENIIFELWGVGLTDLEPFRLISWLIYQFGPEVNIANIWSQQVPLLESLRRGTLYEMDHPYMRWLKEGKPIPNWWRMEPPPYDIGLERG